MNKVMAALVNGMSSGWKQGRRIRNALIYSFLYSYSVNTELQLHPTGPSSEGPLCVKDRDTYHANLFHGLQLELAVGDEPKF